MEISFSKSIFALNNISSEININGDNTANKIGNNSININKNIHKNFLKEIRFITKL
jgi:hypothetical protein